PPIVGAWGRDVGGKTRGGPIDAAPAGATGAPAAGRAGDRARAPPVDRVTPRRRGRPGGAGARDVPRGRSGLRRTRGYRPSARPAGAAGTHRRAAIRRSAR